MESHIHDAKLYCTQKCRRQQQQLLPVMFARPISRGTSRRWVESGARTIGLLPLYQPISCTLRINSALHLYLFLLLAPPICQASTTATGYTPCELLAGSSHEKIVSSVTTTTVMLMDIMNRTTYFSDIQVESTLSDGKNKYIRTRDVEDCNDNDVYDDDYRLCGLQSTVAMSRDQWQKCDASVQFVDDE